MAGQPQGADTIIEARWIVPVEPPGAVLTGHSIVVTAGKIAAILPSTEAAQRFSAARRIALAEHALIPGLVNLHTHAAMTLMRGMADDRALMDWLNNHIWPVETRLVSDQFVHDGTLLACAEMLRGGVTCFNDMYFFPEAAARAALAAGMRAALGIIVVEFPSPYAADAQDYLNKGLATRDALRDEPLLTFCMAPHAPYTVSDRSLQHVAMLAGELDIPIHMHLHETDDEIRQSVVNFSLRPLARLRALGLLGANLIAVHAIHLTPDEIGLLAAQGCHVAHCPSSNLKLASGIAPVAELRRHAVNIGIGTDGAASNNRLDVLHEMRLAALLAKGASGEPTALPAHQALEMATLGAARALALEDRIGSLTVGKCADITAVNLSGVELSPCYDPISHLVYVAGREHVSHVWVNGVLLVEEGSFVKLDCAELESRAAHWKGRIREVEASATPGSAR
ncbi:MAG: TRZ/ATZ family hydrolase [Betaproteobacteria bacterium]|nr:TRZ/ATZ family hydrolase [Betaproteobacteria bacterium]